MSLNSTGKRSNGWLSLPQCILFLNKAFQLNACCVYVCMYVCTYACMYVWRQEESQKRNMFDIYTCACTMILSYIQTYLRALLNNLMCVYFDNSDMSAKTSVLISKVLMANSSATIIRVSALSWYISAYV